MTEISTLTILGVTLFILGALVVTVVTLVGFASNVTQRGLTGVDNSLQAIMDADIEAFDQESYSGSQVLSTIKTKKGTNLAVVVQTKAIKAKGGTNKGVNYGLHLEGASVSDDLLLVELGDRKDKNTYFVKDLKSPKERNNNLTGTKEEGKPGYIRKAARFDSFLIKDNNGVVVGIYFKQVDE